MKKGRIVDLKQIMQTKLAAQLTPINHESLNRTFFGYSQKYCQKIFVKVFSQESKFLTEKAVNEQLNSRVLASFKIENLFALVMTDIAPVDLSEQLSPELAFGMGKKLAEFHQHVRPFAGIYPNNDFFSKVKYDISTLKKALLKDRLTSLLTIFNEEKAEINQDIKTHATTVLHGDVGLRNYQMVDGKLVLIDFERARMGVNYQDFIKLFYQDFALKQNLLAAFLKGYGLKVEIKELTQVFLIFITAIGILRYTAKISDPDFEEIGLKMLETVDLFLNKQFDNDKDLMNAIIK